MGIVEERAEEHKRISEAMAKAEWNQVGPGDRRMVELLEQILAELKAANALKRGK